MVQSACTGAGAAPARRQHHPAGHCTPSRSPWPLASEVRRGRAACMGTKYKARAGCQFSAEDGFCQGVGMVSAGAWGDGVKHSPRHCPVPPPCACALQVCRSGAAPGSSSTAATVPMASQPHRVVYPVGVHFPLCLHRQHHQPQLWPFTPTAHLMPSAADHSTWDLADPNSSHSPWASPAAFRGVPAAVLTAPLPSLSSGFNNHPLAQYRKRLQQPKAVAVSPGPPRGCH